MRVTSWPKAFNPHANVDRLWLPDAQLIDKQTDPPRLRDIANTAMISEPVLHSIPILFRLARWVICPDGGLSQFKLAKMSNLTFN